ncbi:DUF5686 and carboxypeptidase-like regulatory domain-containing protein [Viscerimonas tarda]
MLRKIIFLYILSLLFCNNIHAQVTTAIQGTVKDSITGAPIPYATVRFEGSIVGELTDDAGKYRIRNRTEKNVVVFSLMGYLSKEVTIPVGQVTQMNVLLVPEGVSLDEVVVRPGKEKYSKENNPAVDLIKKVIEHKNDMLIANQDYYKSDEYDRIFFAFNEFDPNQLLFKNFKFLHKYETKSKINGKPILPFSVRETLSEVYYRKKPKGTRTVITAYQNEGLDQELDTEAINTIVSKTFADVSITDNNINMLYRDFVGPLSSTNSVDFYKWYLIDTVTIDSARYVNLGFVPFNTRDIGFSGNLYITTDSTYAIKRILMRVPTKINMNFIESMMLEQEFEQKAPNLWIPTKYTTSMEFSLFDTFKFYVEKVKTFSNFSFNEPVDAIFLNPAPEIRLSGYNKHNEAYWKNNRPEVFNNDYNMDDMMHELMADKTVSQIGKIANIISSGYIATSKDPDKNKIDIGTVETLYSYNNLEGNRLRLTGATTRNLHKHLFLYGYFAYGFKDGKPKYMGEATWAFNHKNYHKNEFPNNNLSISYKYDVAALGQQFLQAERDNILLSISNRSRTAKLAYDQASQISYIKEYYSGFSFNIYAITHNQKPAMNITFEKQNDLLHKLDTVRNLRTSEVMLMLRYAPNEKFFQRRRLRQTLPTKGFIYNFSFLKGFENLLGGQYNYTKLYLSIDKEMWVAPYGKIYSSVKGERIFGKVPYPLLVSANANNSITLQNGSFNLLNPLEFINDIQLSWNVKYKMGGWLFNRIPVVRSFKWREVFEFSGFTGSLSRKNNPLYNRDLMLFPEDSYSMTNMPYMEFNVGVENILKFFRIDYVRRLNYLDHPGINKEGVRINFSLNF